MTCTSCTGSRVPPTCSLHLWLRPECSTHQHQDLHLTAKEVCCIISHRPVQTICDDKWSQRTKLLLFSGASVKTVDLPAFGVTLRKQTYFHIIKTMTNLSSRAWQESHSQPSPICTVYKMVAAINLPGSPPLLSLSPPLLLLLAPELGPCLCCQAMGCEADFQGDKKK